MAVERFFARTGLRSTSAEIGSNEAIKQAIVGVDVGIVTPCFGTRRHKGPLTILDVEGFPIQRHWYRLSSQQTTVRCRSHFSGISTG